MREGGKMQPAARSDWMESTSPYEASYLLLCGGRGAPQTLVFDSEDQARAEFRKISRAARVKTQWMELSVVAGGGRLERLASYARRSS
ncbi:MAG TPA: hypothetical protein VM942_02305 [Acidimicrobiales bacterium]|nr:hypothetical protein [Acidimicrobiales bacterium]